MVCPSQYFQRAVDDEQFSATELSVLNGFQNGHILVLLKGYFDGGNKPDSTQYKTASLASIIAPSAALKAFECAWKANLNKYEAAYLHTADAVALKRIYKTGWDRNRRDCFIQDCARIIETAILKQVRGKVISGIVPCAITIDLTDFNRARTKTLSSPQVASEVLASHALYKMIECGNLLGAHFFELFFDQNEPYRGHIVDRFANPKFSRMMKEKNRIDVERRFILGPEVKMRNVPALQAADLIAWSIGHRNAVKFEWQKSVLAIQTESQLLDYAALSKPDPMTIDFIKYCKLPQRAPTK